MATYTRQNTKVITWVSNVTYAADLTTATAVQSNVVMQSLLVNSALSSDVVSIPTNSVSFDLLDPTLASTTITAGGKTVSYPQLAALLRQAALDRANAAGVT